MEQQPLYNSINFNLSVAFHDNDTCSLTALNVYLCPSDDRSFGRAGFRGSARSRKSRHLSARRHIVDTLSRGNYVGMYGIGEICSQSGALDSPNNNGAGPLGQHAGIFYRNSATRISAVTDGTSNTIMCGERSHNLSYVTWVARSIDGWLGKTSPIEGGTDQFNPSPEECWTQIMGPAGLEDGTRTINNPEAHVEDYWSMHPGGANMLFADGSVHFLKSSISPVPWRASGDASIRRGDLV